MGNIRIMLMSRVSSSRFLMLRMPGFLDETGCWKFLRIPPTVERRLFLLKHIKSKVGRTSDFSYVFMIFHFFEQIFFSTFLLSNLKPRTHLILKKLLKYERIKPSPIIHPTIFQAARRMLKPCSQCQSNRVHN